MPKKYLSSFFAVIAAIAILLPGCSPESSTVSDEPKFDVKACSTDTDCVEGSLCQGNICIEKKIEPPSPQCVPNCDNKVCGPDGCGGICGTCAEGQICNDLQQCEAMPIGCIPNCDGKECGSDGCEGKCGTCLAWQNCSNVGKCECVPDCAGKQCGRDGCGGLCGTCPEGQACNTSRLCQTVPIGCVPNCTGKTCGSDGCRGICGVCSAGLICSVAGKCECVPNCVGKACGPDGCGGTCGACQAWQKCSADNKCKCVPNCTGKVCGDDGCGGTCGACQAEEACNANGTACDELLMPEPAPRVPTGAWSHLLKDPSIHPRLIGPKENLKKLSIERKALYDDIKKGINYATAVPSNHIVWAGVQNAVEGQVTGLYSIDDYIAEVAKYIAEGPKNEHVNSWVKLEIVARTFDFFHDKIPPEKRKAMIDYVNGHLEVYRTDEWGLSTVANIGSKIRSYLWVAYATWGENPKAQEFRDYALIKLYENKLVPVLNQLGQGGGLPDGGSYNRIGLFALADALELARRVEGYDGFAKAPKFFYQRLAYEILDPYPGLIPLGKYFLEAYGEEGDAGGTSTGDGPRLARSIIAQYFRGSTLDGYIASKARWASYAPVKVYDFLWIEDPEDPLDITTFPLSHLAAGVGNIHARGDWSDDATKFRFECGPFYSNHQHFEAGNFEIFRKEPLATESGVYDWYSNHNVNWYIRTIAHNSMLIYMPDEKWGMMRDGNKNPYFNDGGQESRYHFVDLDLPEWLAHKDKYQSGNLISYLDQDEFMYAMCDGTKAYNPKKLKNWTREMLFIRPHTVVILDRVNNQDTPYEKTWLLHSKGEPVLNESSYVIPGAKHDLYVKTLLPATAIASKIQGYTYGGQTFDPTVRNAGENLWRIEVKPKENKVSEIFLHVISTEKMPAASAVMNGNDVDLTVDDIKIKFSATGDGLITVGGKSHPLKKEMKPGIYEK